MTATDTPIVDVIAELTDMMSAITVEYGLRVVITPPQEGERRFRVVMVATSGSWKQDRFLTESQLRELHEQSVRAGGLRFRFSKPLLDDLRKNAYFISEELRRNDEITAQIHQAETDQAPALARARASKKVWPSEADLLDMIEKLLHDPTSDVVREQAVAALKRKGRPQPIWR